MLFHGNQQTSVIALSMCNATEGVFVCTDSCDCTLHKVRAYSLL